MPVVDTLGRPVRDLRISVTDRCNFRCTYCMPKEVFNREYEFLGRDLLLSFEEIERIARTFAGLGVEKIRLSGGEPLLRREIEDLIRSLVAIEGIADVTLTTNGSLLERKAGALAAAGLNRVTVSLDSLDDEVFMAMNDVGFPASKVLDGIEAAAAAGLDPVKINMVVKRGVNDGSVLAMARHFRGTGHIVRFIEYMDVGRTNGWRLDDVVPAAEIINTINAVVPSAAGGGQLPRRGGPPLALPRWRWRDRRHHLGERTFLRHLHPGTIVRRGIALHLPVRLQGHRPARSAAPRRYR